LPVNSRNRFPERPVSVGPDIFNVLQSDEEQDLPVCCTHFPVVLFVVLPTLLLEQRRAQVTLAGIGQNGRD
jgi:hypothetical protein